MINTRKIGGRYCIYSASTTENMERRTGSVTCSPKRLPKGGQRWDNTSDKGGVING